MMMNNKHSFRTSVRYLISNTKCVLEHNKRRKELQEKLSRAKEAKTNPNVGANKTELGMIDGKQTLITDTGWYEP